MGVPTPILGGCSGVPVFACSGLALPKERKRRVKPPLRPNNPADFKRSRCAAWRRGCSRAWGAGARVPGPADQVAIAHCSIAKQGAYKGAGSMTATCGLR